jgi:hypothetical protein
VPIGTAFIQHTRWDAAGLIEEAKGKRVPSDRKAERRSRPEAGRPPEGKVSAGKTGPVDSRRVATEVLAGLRLAEEFPSAT